MKLAYQAVDATGKMVSDTIEAADVAEAIELLRRQGLFASDVRPATGAAGRADANGSSAASSGGLAGLFPGRGKRLSGAKRLKNLAMFTRQLQVLVSSGTPLVQAIASLERQAKDRAWRDVLGDLRVKIEEGATLSEAMAHQPRVFDPVCRSLIAAGESGGSFDQMLERLATLCRKQTQIRSAITGAMVYPCLLIVIAVNVLGVMLLFVLPRFTGLFEQLDAELPPTTKLLVAASDFLRGYWWAALIGLAAAAFGVRAWARSKAGREALDAVVLKLPMFGPIVKNFAVARIARVLGVLVVGKVPLLDALALARQTASNVRYNRLMASAELAVERGSSISAAFADSTLVDPSLVEAIRSGEQSGQIGPLLLNIADFLDEDNEVVIKSLTSIIEPVILIGLGLMVGFIAMSMFLPLFDLTSAVQGGH